MNDEVVCARNDCGKTFIRGTHNQKYCSKECFRITTNKKIVERYHENKKILNGKRRDCRLCGNALSRYNKTNKCSACSSSSGGNDLINFLESIID